MPTATKKVAKKAPVKKATSPKPVAKQVPVKPAVKKKTASAPKESKRMKKLEVGNQVFTLVDRRQNGGSDVAAAQVTKVGDDTVNIQVTLDSDESLWLTNVLVVAKAPKDGEKSPQRVCWPA